MRSVKDDDSAVSVVIGTVLVLAILVTFMAGFLNFWVPVYEKQNEMDHGREVLGSFTDIQMKIDNIDHFPVRIPIDVGTNSIFYLSGTRSYGELEVNESDYWITINSANFTDSNGNGFAGGDGTEDNPYQISNVQQLQNIEDDLEAHYILVNDIDASESENFMPINSFEGSLDGQGYRIDRLSVNIDFRAGLFARSNGEIRDVALTNINVIGGISQESNRDVGGLVGYNEGIIESSFVTGSVSTDANNVYIGGLVGRNTDTGTISNSYSQASITGAGGGATAAGGFVGENMGDISNSYSTGSISSSGNVGGFAGDNSSTITSSYWDTETSGQNDSAGGEGKTTEEMQQQSTFTDWNFTNIWSIDEGNDYPRLIVFQDPGNGNGNDHGNGFSPAEQQIFSAGSISLTSDYNSLVNQKYIYAQGSIILEQDDGGVLWEEPLLRYNQSSQTIYIRLVDIEGNRVSYGNFKDSLRITLIDRKTSALSPASDGEIKIQYKENDLWNRAFEDFFNNIPGNTYSPGEIIIHSENLNLIVEKIVIEVQ